MFLLSCFFSSEWTNFQEFLQREDKRKDDCKDEEETEDDNNQEEYDPMEAEDAEDEDEGILNQEFCGFQINFFIATAYTSFFQAGRGTGTRKSKIALLH